MDTEEKILIQRITKDGKIDSEDVVTKEMPLTIILINTELVTLLCSPIDIKYIVIGFLTSEGLLKSKSEIKKIFVDDKRGVVRVDTVEEKSDASQQIFKRMITSGCGRGASFYSSADVGEHKVESPTTILSQNVFTLVQEFQHHSLIYRTTGGVHSAALCDTQNILIFNEDIGRHNAIDKIIGECVLNDVPTDGRIIITSGRISSEILLKVTKRNIAILISKGAPTNLGVKLANDLGVTLIGFVRGQRMNVYTHGWRVITDGK
jgi:FdhD protein